jgi:hypothetical protein
MSRTDEVYWHLFSFEKMIRNSVDGVIMMTPKAQEGNAKALRFVLRKLKKELEKGELK